jgi:hypothetical protein
MYLLTQDQLNEVSGGNRVRIVIEGAKIIIGGIIVGVLGNKADRKVSEIENAIGSWGVQPPCTGSVRPAPDPDFVGPPEPTRCGGAVSMDASGGFWFSQGSSDDSESQYSAT